jgi:hypothetical protein
MIDFDLALECICNRFVLMTIQIEILGFQRCIALPSEGDTTYVVFPPLIIVIVVLVLHLRDKSR